MDCAKTAPAGDDPNTAPLTFFIPLNRYKPEGPGESLPSPQNWLARQWQSIDADLPPLDELLKQGRMTLLLDAINEMPAAREQAGPRRRNA
jgi:hypothetical protein